MSELLESAAHLDPTRSAAEVDALLARIDALTCRATTAATAGDSAQLSATLAERDELLAGLGPLLRAAAGGAPLPEALAAAVERQLGALVQRNLELHAIVTDARAEVIAAMQALHAAGTERGPRSAEPTRP